MSTYILIHQYNISSSAINRLRHGQPISTATIDNLCGILGVFDGGDFAV